ncbi:hypothetical protein Tco_1208732 [Tanacetum coccineum]
MLRVFPMSLTGAASGWLRNQPSGSIKTWVDLKTKFLNKYCPPARTAKKMKEINNFQQETDETLFQAWERFKELLIRCPQHYLTDMQEVILFYNGLDIPTRQILNLKGVVPSMTAPDAKKAIQEMAKYSQKWHNEGKAFEEAYYTQFGAPYQLRGQYRATCPGFYQRNNTIPSYAERRQSLEESLAKSMAKSTRRHEENSAIIKEIRASSDTAIRNQGASIKTLELQIGQMSKVLQECGFGNLPGSTEINPRDHVKEIATARSDWNGIRHIASYEYAVSNLMNSNVYPEPKQYIPFPKRLHDCTYNEVFEWKHTYLFNITDQEESPPHKEKDPGSFTLPSFINDNCFKKIAR